jgi:DinB superfamily
MATGYLAHDRAGDDGRWISEGAVIDIATSLVSTFDHVWDRLTGRLVGLTDDEYLWEPAAGCWSLRRDGQGRWRLDGDGGGGPAPDPVPVTTIAWRLGHLGGLALGGMANWRFGDGSLTVESIDFPGRATDVGAFLDGYYRTWRHGLVGLDDAGWEAPLGVRWGAYAEDTTVDLALHVLDEVIHHGAEVGVLRDLYAHRTPDGPGPGLIVRESY